MKQTAIKTILIALLPILWAACGDDDNNPDINGGELKISIDAKNNEIPGKGGGLFLRIETNSEWTASVQDSWCTLQRSSGTGTSSVMCAVTANTGKQRSTIITVKSGKEVQEITLTQKEDNGEIPGPDPDPDRPSIYRGRIEIPALKGGNMNLFITHTTPYNGQEAITYSFEYDCIQKSSRWVAFTFNSSTPDNDVSRAGDFTEDPKIPTQYQTHDGDYTNSGYSRGHLTASSDRQYSVAANKQTFYMSNINPQTQDGFNGRIWAALEKKVQSWGNISNNQDTLYVAKGGTIDDKNNIIKYLKTNNTIPVPKYFYMAILSLKNGQYKAIGFWFEHKAYTNSNYATYALPIDELEQKTGINFFHNLPDNIENEVELTYNKSDWGI